MLTFQKYNAIRILIKSGENADVIAETFGCKKETVILIGRCETYDQYKNEIQTRRYMAKANKQNTRTREETGQPGLNIGQIKIEATHYMMEELKRNNELLTLISNKLTAIMEELGVLNK